MSRNGKNREDAIALINDLELDGISELRIASVNETPNLLRHFAAIHPHLSRGR